MKLGKTDTDTFQFLQKCGKRDQNCSETINYSYTTTMRPLNQLCQLLSFLPKMHKGRSFQSIRYRPFHAISNEVIQDCFLKCKHRWDKYVNKKEEYFEGDND